MKFLVLLFLFFMNLQTVFSQEISRNWQKNQKHFQENFIENLLKTEPDKFKEILENLSKYEVQIIFTQINRSKNNKPKFTTYTFNTTENSYFYPASTVKLPASILALEKLNNLNIKGLNKESALITGTNFEKQTPVFSDSSSANGLPSIAHYIKKILLVSDNDAFNRLYEFIGQNELNSRLHNLGFKNTNIVHRLEANLTAEQNRHTNPIRFYNSKNLVYEQAGQYNAAEYSPKKTIKKGVGYLNAEGKLINEPLDFSQKNEFSITDQHIFLQKLIFPKSFNKNERFNLKKSDYEFLYKYMSLLPNEADYPKYNRPDYWPTYCKFLLFGSDSTVNIPPNIKIFNKVGDAYGYLIDNAYIVDYEYNIEFFLSAIIHCNADLIYNDNKYEYETIGLPFMKNLGQIFYNLEKNRAKKITQKMLKVKL